MRSGRDGTAPNIARILGSYLGCPKQLLLLLRLWVFHPLARAYVRLLGPCFKTGRTVDRHWHCWHQYVESPTSSKPNRIGQHLRADTNTIDQLSLVTSERLRRRIYFFGYRYILRSNDYAEWTGYMNPRELLPSIQTLHWPFVSVAVLTLEKCALRTLLHTIPRPDLRSGPRYVHAS